MAEYTYKHNIINNQMDGTQLYAVMRECHQRIGRIQYLIKKNKENSNEEDAFSYFSATKAGDFPRKSYLLPYLWKSVDNEVVSPGDFSGPKSYTP
jgi:hypothetical protein